MKAVILAGGEGSRLRPLTIGRPKPMTPLFGKPVLGHILDLLRRHGVTDVAVTLRCLPNAVMDVMGKGEDYGVRLTYFVEEAPLGTAGSVKKCAPFLGEEDFLVISGDAVCDLDLQQLMAFHAAHRSAASLALCRRREPLEYGLVRTDESGRILGFVEKPGWGEVDTELVNTGIYVLSHRCMELVPDGVPYDFGRELFPALLAKKEALYGWEIPGYWQDMGDCGAYLECVQDVLSGKARMDLTTGRTAPPAGVEVREPCWIGRRVSLAPGCAIGPFTVLGEGSTVETGAVVERSVLLGAGVGEGAEVTGAILCKGAAVHRRAMVNAGAVLGENSVVGAEAIVAPGVKLWPRRAVPEGGRATASQVSSAAPSPLKFSEGGALMGTLGEELTPETLLALGALLGEWGQVGLGWAGGNGAGMLARAALSGICAAGGSVLAGDAPCPSAHSWLTRYYQLPVSLFVQQDGDAVRLRLFGPDGLPLDRSAQRKLEGALIRGEGSRVPAVRVGALETVAGVRSGYAREAERLSRLSTLPLRPTAVRVERGPVNDILAAALSALGCEVSREAIRGRPAFSSEAEGFGLSAWDEEGEAISSDRLLVLLTRIDMEHGAKQVALPPWAPAAADTVARHFGGEILRLGRDDGAMELWRKSPWLWDALFAACRLCSRLGVTGESLRQLDRSVPRFSTVRGEIPLRSGRGKVMEECLHDHPAARREGEGTRIPVGAGWVYLVPMSRRSALRVIAEATDTEAARELCQLYEEKIREWDEKAPS